MKGLFLALAAAALLAGCASTPPPGYDPAQKAANYSQNEGQAVDGADRH